MHNANEIRNSFLNFFKMNDHEIIKSSSLVPHNDPSLMFTNAGMVQFKNVFTGEEKASYLAAATSQKCVRAGGKHNDLDNVGYTARHHTFFEMLGNFSFGKFFKEKAIFYAWEYLTKEVGLDKSKLYVTVYHEDDESYDLWKKIAGFNSDRIIRIKTDDNFWSMGNTGPCGPSTEIFYDHGESVFGSLPGTEHENGDRFIEVWNLVFMQFEMLEDGSKIALPKACVDTGMGLERISAILQGKQNNYEIDLFAQIINNTENIVGVKAQGKDLFSYRVIADHLRSTAFLIADGVMPSNEGRGYVLRRILRRAMRHINHLGYKDLLMPQLVKILKDEMGDSYPELIRAEKLIEQTYIQEEEKFKKLLNKGLQILNVELNNDLNKKVFSGKTAFKLYDTYGFPLDLTTDILRDKDIKVNIDEFDANMKKQKEAARAAWVGSGEKKTSEEWFELYQQHGATEFLGYNNHLSSAHIIYITDFKEGYKLVVTNQTPFYAESGGQKGDVGVIYFKNSNQLKVIDTIKFINKIHGHVVKDSVDLKVGEEVSLKIDVEYRNNLKANHSATHLLHYALKKIVGDHVVQKGSLVESERFRFDFSNNSSLSAETILKVEEFVNQLIRDNYQINTKIKNIDDAISDGATALFGEKYDDEVRVVSMGSSVELCGGTHVTFTGDIGYFKIISESSIASGIRRIEALTGNFAVKYANNQSLVLKNITQILKTSDNNLLVDIDALLTNNKKLIKEIHQLKAKNLLSSEDIKNHSINGHNISYIEFKDVSSKDLRSFVENYRNKYSDIIILALSIYEGKTSMMLGSGANVKTVDCSQLIVNLNTAGGGKGGGGRPQLAQAGGFDFGRNNLIIEKLLEDIGNI